MPATRRLLGGMTSQSPDRQRCILTIVTEAHPAAQDGRSDRASALSASFALPRPPSATGVFPHSETVARVRNRALPGECRRNPLSHKDLRAGPRLSTSCERILPIG